MDSWLPRSVSAASLSSRSRRAGSMPCRSSARRRFGTRPGSRSCCTERFTAMRGGSMPCACHCAICAQAASITQPPRSTIRPDSSAAGMKSADAITPSRGDCQRSSASTPSDAAVGHCVLWLEVQREFVALECAAQSALGDAHAAARHPRVVEHGCALAQALGAIHGEVGVVQQLIQLRAIIREQRDADAGANLVVLAGDAHRQRQRMDDALGNRGSSARIRAHCARSP